MSTRKLWVAALCAAGSLVSANAADPATEGYVRVSLPQVELRGGFALLPAAAKSRKEKKQTFKLLPTPEHGPHARGAWLPAGEYQLAGVTARDGSPYPPIIVRAGEITDLRALIRVPLGGYEAAELAVVHSEASAELASAITALAGQLKSTDPITWAPTDPPKAINLNMAPNTNMGLVGDLIMAYNDKVNRPAFHELMRAAPTVAEMWRLARATMKPLTDEPAVDATGNLYYGANLGQIRLRSPVGEWSHLDVGTLEHITAVEAEGTRLLAGTGLGSIFASDDRGASWTRIAKLQPGDGVLDIDHIGERWLFVGARYTLLPPNPAGYPNMRTIHEVRLYSASSRTLADLAILRELSRPEAGAWGGYAETYSGTLNGSNYYLSTIDEMLKLDTGTLIFTPIKVPHKVGGFNVIGTTPVITAFLSAGVRSKVSVSRDGGASWTEYKRPAINYYDAVFDEAGRGTASRWSVGLWMSTLEVVDYDAAGKDWKLRHQLPPGCMQVLRDADNVQRFCVTTGGSILARDGDSWKAEFAVE